MMSSTLGAPLGGTTLGFQYGLDRSAPRFTTPPNLDGAGGRYLPSIVSVALGEPGVPFCCARAGPPARTWRITSEKTTLPILDASPAIAALLNPSACDPGKSPGPRVFAMGHGRRNRYWT